MEAEEVLKLFDSFWFGLQNLEEHPSPSTSTSFDFDANPDHQIKEGPSEEPKLSRMQTSHHTRSMSDQLNSMASFKHDSSLSPDSVLFSPKLQTILSGKDVTDIEAEKQDAQVVQQKLRVLLPEKKNIIRRGRGKRESKSLSDLEFEELKGFMDLGFVFSEEDKDSSLASIIPGLQRLGKNNGEEEEEEEEEKEDFDESAVQRPYLSEAWKVQEERRKKENPFMNWKIPAVTNENDMKYSLRCWAHTVASTVR